MAAYYAYRMAGVRNPCDDFDVIELHDAFTISDVQTYEDIGLRPYGYGRDFVESGDCYHTNPHTANPASCPPTCRAASSVACTRWVRAASCRCSRSPTTCGPLAEIHGDQKRWDEFGREKPEDWTDLQVEDAHRALSISHAGVGSHVTATILMDPDHLLNKDA